MYDAPPTPKDELFGWLRHMNKYKGSDLFVTPNFPPAMKVDGKITRLSDEPLSAERCMEITFSIMNQKQIEEFSNTNECNFSISLPDTSRFRVNAMVQRGATTLVLRSITGDIPKFETLNLPPILQEIALRKRGLVIFTGATGSGKSTSLASLIDYRNENSFDHIITIEDPIEFVHQHKNSIITQREIGVDTENWSVALKNTLRQAPDVILIGEIRDRETMDYAIAFSETGHLCLATLHANNTNQALDRIINFFPEERRTQLLTDLSLNLQAFISQRLIPRESGKGRVAAVEVLLNSPLIADLIHKGEIYGIKELMKKSTAQGMQTFDQALYELYENGDISFQEAIKNADSAHDLRLDIQLRSRRAQNAGPDLELI
ncbi:PilT/PilU family type 4a pilus ATPase [Neisseria perflava]|uniref:PilT/PilU family type 4a pilus ATPase n=1 Tax=Neisseria perflava TaxID=33053 RepID=UPI0020A0AAAC|nr:PilT/PilU family type 4a pilus ATPase [Neisseria perflava]